VKQRYGNLSGTSGVTDYDIGDDYILVWFGEGEPYRYSSASPGREHVEQLKRCAIQGHGLATYINQNVRDRFERRG
jgi:hypothetical protein